MVIIFEGIDGSGKTTIFKELKKELKTPIFIDFDFYKEFKEKDYYYFEKAFPYAEALLLNTFIQNPETLWILDRSFISTIIYSPILRSEWFRQLDPALIPMWEAREQYYISLLASVPHKIFFFDVKTPLKVIEHSPRIYKILRKRYLDFFQKYPELEVSIINPTSYRDIKYLKEFIKEVQNDFNKI